MERTSQEMLADMLNSEIDRYWTRFNIFAAVQLGAFVGLFNTMHVLLVNQMAFRFILVLLIWFSVTGVIAVIRGLDLQRSLVLALGEVEQNLPKHQRLMSMTSKYSRVPIFLTNHSCTIFCILCCLGWIAAWIWLEWTHFSAIALPGNP